ncbi:MAG: DUF4124 domain-containing protein [Nitrospirota bacterium]
MNRRRTLAFILTAVLLVSFAPSASALYQWVDEKGDLHITDNPPPSRQSREVPDAPPPAPAPEARPAAPSTAPQAATPAPAPSQSSSPATTLRPAAASSPSPAAPHAVPVPAPAAPSAPAPAMPAVKEAPGRSVPSPVLPGSAPPADLLTALLAGFMTVFLFITVGMYIFFSLCLYLIAKKLNVAEAWAAWIPIIQAWPFLSSAGKPCWWVILLLVPLVNIFIGVYLWMCIAENLGRNKWLGLLMLLPIINFVFMGVLAFSKGEGDQQTAGT